MNYFTDAELQCHCKCGYSVRPEFKALLNRIREDFGHPIGITNAARCRVHNKAVGGAQKSAHLDGVAADLVRTKELREFIEANLEKYNIWIEHPSKTGTDEVGWLHLDSRLRIGGRVFYP